MPHFPFDWLLTLNHAKFIELLKNDFDHFLDPEFFFKHPNLHRWTAVENKFYEIEFRHDQIKKGEGNSEQIYKQQLNDIQTKYTKRIKRFRALKNYKGKVFFIRSAYDFKGNEDTIWGDYRKQNTQSYYTPDQAIELYKTLKFYFPKVKFNLIIINY